MDESLSGGAVESGTEAVATLAAMEIVADVERWTAVGFAASATGAISFRNGAITFGAATMIRATQLPSSADVADLDGISIRLGVVQAATPHPNGSFALDHLVIGTDSLERTSAAVHEVLGLELLRVRETSAVRQGFHRFPSADRSGCIVEVVESPHTDRTQLFGLVVITTDLDSMCSSLGPDVIGPAKDAVQRGRRIATFRAGARLGTAVAMITPEPDRPNPSD